MRGGPRRLAQAALAVVALSACGLIGVDAGPAPGAAEFEPDTEPIGEVVEVGSGSSLGLEWRYSVYESAMGSTGMPSIVEGWATDEVAAVAIVLEGGRHLSAALMSLQRAGADGLAFIAFVPEGLRMDRAVALDQAGQEIGTEVIDAP